MTELVKAQTLDAAGKSKVLIWDLPTRVFHWLLLGAFASAWLTHDDNRYLDVHVYAGYLFLGLLLFRLAWGVWGSHHARFHTFAHDWPSVSAYLKGLLTGEAERYLGHNPIGGWAIFLMLGLGLVVSIAGVALLGGQEHHGPLAGLLSFEAGEWADLIHDTAAWAMLALIATHIAGVITESIIHRDNLIWAMVTGYKDGGEPGATVSTHGLVGVGLLSLALGLGIVYFAGYFFQTAERPYRPFVGPQLPDDPLWRQECSDCHLAFHPVLLPARSWERVFAEQAEHFGEDLFLDEETVAALRSFAVANAAESHLTEAAWKIDHTTPGKEAPLRITETPYWVKKHEDIAENYWKHPKVKVKSNCEACHLDAKDGTFEDAAMRLPKAPAAE